MKICFDYYYSILPVGPDDFFSSSGIVQFAKYHLAQFERKIWYETHNTCDLSQRKLRNIGFVIYLLCLNYLLLIAENMRVLLGLKVRRILFAAKRASKLDSATRTAELSQIGDEIMNILGPKNNFKRRISTWLQGSCVTFAFTTTKLFYLINCLWQLYQLNSYLSKEKGLTKGYNFILDIFMDSRSWNKTGLFPRYGWCEYQVGQKQFETSQFFQSHCFV